MNYIEIITQYLSLIGDDINRKETRTSAQQSMREIYQHLHGKEKTENIIDLETTITLLNYNQPRKDTENKLRKLTENLHEEYTANILKKVSIHTELDQEKIFTTILDIYSKHKQQTK
ncbi:MAG: hypothetical protein ACLFN8_05090 [Candidatus Woesearchaeota archaeon]